MLGGQPFKPDMALYGHGTFPNDPTIRRIEHVGQFITICCFAVVG